MRVRFLPPVFRDVAEKRGSRFLNGSTQVRFLPSRLCSRRPAEGPPSSKRATQVRVLPGAFSKGVYGMG